MAMPSLSAIYSYLCVGIRGSAQTTTTLTLIKILSVSRCLVGGSVFVHTERSEEDRVKKCRRQICMISAEPVHNTSYTYHTHLLLCIDNRNPFLDLKKKQKLFDKICDITRSVTVIE